jgi:hypothetical protein
MTTNENTVEVKTKLRKTRRLKMAYNVSQYDKTKIAAIRFSGQYLESLGFSHEGFFDLTINPDGSLTIRPVTREQHESEALPIG